MICPQCGQVSPDTVQFCSSCGQLLSNVTLTQPSPGYAPPPGQPQGYAPPQAPYGQPQSPGYPPPAQPGQPPPSGYAPYQPPPGQTQPYAPTPGQQPYLGAPGYGTPPVASNQCRVCGAVVAPNLYQCPRCNTPVGMVANPNDPTSASYLPVGGYRQIENTSGQRGTVPPELQGGWNWGAAFLAFFWAIAHRIWGVVFLMLALFVLSFSTRNTSDIEMTTTVSPIVSIINIVLIIYMGTQGNALAWRYRHFDSVEHCREVQRAWARWLFLLVIVIPLAVAAIILIGSRH